VIGEHPCWCETNVCVLLVLVLHWCWVTPGGIYMYSGIAWIIPVHYFQILSKKSDQKVWSWTTGNWMKYFPRINIVVDRTGPIYFVRFGKIGSWAAGLDFFCTINRLSHSSHFNIIGLSINEYIKVDVFFSRVTRTCLFGIKAGFFNMRAVQIVGLFIDCTDPLWSWTWSRTVVSYIMSIMHQKKLSYTS
jgi:hypothetical protein